MNEDIKYNESEIISLHRRIEELEQEVSYWVDRYKKSYDEYDKMYEGWKNTAGQMAEDLAIANANKQNLKLILDEIILWHKGQSIRRIPDDIMNKLNSIMEDYNKSNERYKPKNLHVQKLIQDKKNANKI